MNALTKHLTQGFEEPGVSSKQTERKAARLFFGERDGHGQFSPGALRKVIGEALTTSYLDSLNLKGAKFSADAFEKYNEAKVKGKDAKATPADEHYKKLNDKPEAGSPKAAVLDALKVDSTAFQTARTEYEKSVANFKNLIESIPKKYQVRDVIGAMKSIVDDGKKSIEQHQKIESDNLEAQFKDPKFRTNLKTALNLGSEEAVDKVHKEMTADLKSTHQTQSSAFDKSTQDSLGGLHKAVAKQTSEFMLIKNMHENSSVMRKLIDEVAKANREQFKLDPESRTTLNLPGSKDENASIEDENASIESVSLDQLKFIKAVGGNEITSKKDDKGNTTYTLDMGMRLLNPRYYATDQYKRDLDTMIQAVRASGSEKITMKVNFDNPDIAKLRGREAYERCLKNGYAPEDINVVVNGVRMGHQAVEKEVNGKKVSIKSIEEELFEGKAKKFQTLQEQSKSIRQELSDVTKGAAIEPTKSSEEIVKNIKTELMEEKKAEQENDADALKEAKAGAEKKAPEVEVKLGIAKEDEVALDIDGAPDKDDVDSPKMGS